MNHWRGHPIRVVDGAHVYEDGCPVADNPLRPCGYCGRPNRPDGHDACLGELPGVLNACCGHGCPREAYVMLDNGTTISGLPAIMHALVRAASTPTDDKDPDA